MALWHWDLGLTPSQTRKHSQPASRSSPDHGMELLGEMETGEAEEHEREIQEGIN